MTCDPQGNGGDLLVDLNGRWAFTEGVGQHGLAISNEAPDADVGELKAIAMTNPHATRMNGRVGNLKRVMNHLVDSFLILRRGVGEPLLDLHFCWLFLFHGRIHDFVQ